MWFKYQYGVDTAVALHMKTLRSYDRPDVQGEEIVTLRRRRVRKVTTEWRFWEIAIGMDELYVPATLGFLELWWAADRCWIHTSTDPDTEPADSWIEVTPPTGQLPLSYPTGNVKLPSFTATIYETVGV